MGLIDMQSEERLLMLRETVEMLSLRGTPCKFYAIDNIDTEVNGDPNVEFEDPVDVNILFEEEPKVILDKMHWLGEDEDLPFVAYVPLIDDKDNFLRVLKYSMFEVPYSLLESGNRRLQITGVRGDKLSPLLWVVKLAPYREWVDVNPETPEVDTTRGGDSTIGYTLLKVDEDA